MQMTDMLGQTGGLTSIARELGLSEAQVSSGAAALVPAILGGFKKQAQSRPEGAEALGGLLGQLGGERLLDDVVGTQPTDVHQGDAVLARIFGSRDVSRTVAQDAAARSGLDPQLLKRMLPLLAMLVTGYLARQRHGPERVPPGGGIAALLRGRPDGSQAAHPGPGLGDLLDLDAPGNGLDDILERRGQTLH